MKISVVGGLGFVGKSLLNQLSKKNHEIKCIDIAARDIVEENIEYIQADTTIQGGWLDIIKDSDAVINLAGVTIFNIWTPEYKKLIYKSRIQTTRNIVEAIESEKETVLLNTSAAGYYGDRGSEILKEDEKPGSDFLAEVCREWEKEAFKAKEKNTRVCSMRFGIVLGNGGALEKMIPLSKLMVNPILGDGSNYFPWIHINDLVSAIIFLIENPEVSGPFNFTSPGFTSQKEFTKKLGKSVNRPAFLHIPEFLIRLFGGDLGKSFLCSQKAYPEKLLENGFNFSFEDAETALENIID